MSDNPLKKFMRTEKMFVALPSDGHYYDDSIIEMGKIKEVGVMPMTAMDEILMNTPDALLNGEGIRKVIESCVPAVKDASKLLMPDFDTLLLAIRKVSYTDNITFASTCPNCKHENEFRVSISGMIDRMEKIPFPTFVDISKEIRVYVRPHSFSCVTFLALQALETGRLMRALQNDIEELNEDLMEKLKNDYGKSIHKLATINFDTILDGIDYIEVKGSGQIDDAEHIKEWLFQLDRKSVDSIKNCINNIPGGIDKKIPVKCEECEHEWKTVVEFNPSDFFGQGS